MLKVLRAGGEEPRRSEPAKLFYLYALKQLGGNADVDQMRSYVKRSFNHSEEGARAFLKIQQLKKDGLVSTCIQSRRTRSRKNRRYQITAVGEQEVARSEHLLRAGENAFEDARRRRY